MFPSITGFDNSTLMSLCNRKHTKKNEIKSTHPPKWWIRKRNRWTDLVLLSQARDPTPRWVRSFTKPPTYSLFKAVCCFHHGMVAWEMCSRCKAECSFCQLMCQESGKLFLTTVSRHWSSWYRPKRFGCAWMPPLENGLVCTWKLYGVIVSRLIFYQYTYTSKNPSVDPVIAV